MLTTGCLRSLPRLSLDSSSVACLRLAPPRISTHGQQRLSCSILASTRGQPAVSRRNDRSWRTFVDFSAGPGLDGERAAEDSERATDPSLEEKAAFRSDDDALGIILERHRSRQLEPIDPGRGGRLVQPDNKRIPPVPHTDGPAGDRCDESHSSEDFTSSAPDSGGLAAASRWDSAG